jgi:threonine aldolase
MRQTGVLASAGIVGLETMVDRLSADHANARRLAEGLSAIQGIEIDPSRVQTNIVIFGLAPESMTSEALVSGLASRGVGIGAIGGRRFRAVTHYQTGIEDIDRAILAVRDVLEATPQVLD